MASLSNINSLPLYSASIGVSTDEDLNFGLLFTLADRVTPLSLSGISFALSVGSFAVLTTAPAGGLSITGAGSNILSAFWPAASKTTWSGYCALGLAASDGTYTRDVFQGQTSSLIAAWGASRPIRLTQITSPSTTLLSAIDAQTVANTAAIATMMSVFSDPTEVSASSYTIEESGWYDFTASAVAVTLPELVAGTLIRISDGSFASSPSITISGAARINNQSSWSITSAGGAVLIAAGATMWRVINSIGGSSGGSGGGGSATGVHIGTDISIGSTEP